MVNGNYVSHPPPVPLMSLIYNALEANRSRHEQMLALFNRATS